MYYVMSTRVNKPTGIKVKQKNNPKSYFREYYIKIRKGDKN